MTDLALHRRIGSACTSITRSGASRPTDQLRVIGEVERQGGLWIGVLIREAVQIANGFTKIFRRPRLDMFLDRGEIRLFRRRDMAAGAFRLCLAAMPAVAVSLPATLAADDSSIVSAEIFGALPMVSDAEISPNGRFLATLRNDDSGTLVLFHDLDNPGSTASATRIEDAVPREVVFANDEVLLLRVAQALKRHTDTGLELLGAERWLAISRTTMQSRQLFGDDYGYYILSAGTLLAAVPDDPNRLHFSRWSNRRGSGKVRSDGGSRIESRSNGSGVSLLSARLDNGAESLVAAGNGDTAYWIADRGGKPLARVDESSPSRGRDAPTELHIYSLQGDDERLTLSQRLALAEDGSHPIVLGGLSVNTGNLLALTSIDGRTAAVEYDLASGNFGAVVAEDPEFDIEGFVYDFRTAAVRGVAYTDDLPRRRYFDQDEQRVQASLSAALPQGVPVIWSRSTDGNRYVVKVVYTDHPAQWFLYDRTHQALTMFASNYQALDGKVFARKEKYDYTASDGLRIPGYMTVPDGAKESPLPLIVLPHGGPQARDDKSFDYWSFFYAARGYLVYQPNFRGSTGYGQAFQEAGEGEWGRRMQDDITEGVRKLIDDGLADPGRICIVGASYGGYAALAGATMTPDLYACAVSVNGFADVTYLIDPDNEDKRAYWKARVGGTADRQSLIDSSPVHQAGEVRAPVLLIHSKEDTVVRVGQSREMAKALEAHGKAVELVELAGEDHWLSRAETRTEMLSRSIELIDRQIGQTGN